MAEDRRNNASRFAPWRQPGPRLWAWVVGGSTGALAPLRAQRRRVWLGPRSVVRQPLYKCSRRVCCDVWQSTARRVREWVSRGRKKGARHAARGWFVVSAPSCSCQGGDLLGVSAGARSERPEPSSGTSATPIGAGKAGCWVNTCSGIAAGTAAMVGEGGAKTAAR